LLCQHGARAAEREGGCEEKDLGSHSALPRVRAAGRGRLKL